VGNLKTYSNVDVDAANESVAGPHEAVDEVEERQQEWHVLHAPCPDYHSLEEKQRPSVSNVNKQLRNKALSL